MGTRRRYTREFKVEAIRLVVERRVTVTQAARELNVHANVLRSWVRTYRADPKQAFPGVGQQAPEAAELTQLRREVARLKMERDILKKPRPSSRRSRREVRLRGETPRDLAGGGAVRGARGLAEWLLCVGPAADECAGPHQCGDPRDHPGKFCVIGLDVRGAPDAARGAERGPCLRPAARRSLDAECRLAGAPPASRDA